MKNPYTSYYLIRSSENLTPPPQKKENWIDLVFQVVGS